MGSSIGRTVGAAIGVVIVMLFFAVIAARMTHTPPAQAAISGR